jgi:hypothetical protein
MCGGRLSLAASVILALLCKGAGRPPASGRGSFFNAVLVKTFVHACAENTPG